MTWVWIILVFVVLVIIGTFVPKPKYRCDMCKDSGCVETNIWYDEVVTVECPKCREKSIRYKKITKIKTLIK